MLQYLSFLLCIILRMESMQCARLRCKNHVACCTPTCDPASPAPGKLHSGIRKHNMLARLGKSIAPSSHQACWIWRRLGCCLTQIVANTIADQSSQLPFCKPPCLVSNLFALFAISLFDLLAIFAFLVSFFVLLFAWWTSPWAFLRASFWTSLQTFPRASLRTLPWTSLLTSWATALMHASATLAWQNSAAHCEPLLKSLGSAKRDE